MSAQRSRVRINNCRSQLRSRRQDGRPGGTSEPAELWSIVPVFPVGISPRAAADGVAAEAARTQINGIANPSMPEVGERYLGTVVKNMNFGSFISLLPGKDGLLHISEVRKLVGGKRIDSVDDVLSVGQKVQVEIKEVDQRGKLSLTPVLEDDEAGDSAE